MTNTERSARERLGLSIGEVSVALNTMAESAVALDRCEVANARALLERAARVLEIAAEVWALREVREELAARPATEQAP